MHSSQNSQRISNEHYPFVLFSCGHATLQEALSVRPSIGPSEAVIELKSGEMSVLDTFCVCLSVSGGLGCGWGLEAPAHPSATIL